MFKGLTWRVAGLQDTKGSRSVYQSLAIKFYSNFVRHGLQSRWTRVIPNRFLARPRFLPLKPPASSHLSPLKIHQNLAQIVLHQINEQYYTNTGQNCNPWHPFGTNHIGSSKPHKTHHPKFWRRRKSPPTNYNHRLIKKYSTKNHGASQNPQLWEGRRSHLSCSYDNKNRGMTHKTIKQPMKTHKCMETHRLTFAKPTKKNWL